MHTRPHRFHLIELLHKTPLHPFLFALYPILGLLAVNISQIYLQDGLKPGLIAFLCMGILLLVLKLVTRNWQVAGLLASLLAAWFFIYGHLYTQVKSLSLFGVVVGRHRYLLLA